jgi:glycosyltransferase involved in cell wall biosynthesis
LEFERAAPPVKVLLISSFVLPHAGGVEQFVEAAKKGLCRRGWDVRVLSCRLVTTPIRADATVPTLFLPPAGWPLPVGGWRILWREVGRADVVVLNGARHLLPIVAAFTARMRHKAMVFVLHGSGAPFTTGSLLYHRVLGSLFEWTLVRPALRLSHPASVSRAGVAGARNRYGVEATYVGYPLRDLPPAQRKRPPRDRRMTIVWVGRLYPEKNPLQAVAAVDRLRLRREATLEVYGEGILRERVEALARSRPWLSVHGGRRWDEIQEIQGEADLCLSTSVREGAQLAVLEALSRGIPVVCTQVGDAPDYYLDASLKQFCVPPGDLEATAAAMLELSCSYDRYRNTFAANASLLRADRRGGVERLAELIERAATAARAGTRGAAVPARLRVR